jgi:hypothetical protein
MATQRNPKGRNGTPRTIRSCLVNSRFRVRVPAPAPKAAGERRDGRSRTVGELVERWLEWRQQVELGQMLPGLLVDAHVASQEMTGDQQAVAFGLLAHSYNTASSELRKLGDNGLAVIAADRAVQVARTVGEPLLLAASAYRLANAFLPAGRVVDAKEGRVVCCERPGIPPRRLDDACCDLGWPPVDRCGRRGSTAGRRGSLSARRRRQPADSGPTMQTCTPSSAPSAWRFRESRRQPSSVLSSPPSSPARRSLPPRRRSTPSARRRSATWRLHRGSPWR